MRSLLKLSFSFFLVALPAFAAGDKLTVKAGYFSIAASTGEQTTTISNPSAFHLGYQRSITDALEFRIGYALLLADFTGSDLGYGLDVGANYYFLSSAADGAYRDSAVSVTTHELWRPFAGVSFNQRNFQSVRNSYAGLGLNAGAERYHNDKMNWVGEVKYTSLGGSNESEATELQLLFGVVFKL